MAFLGDLASVARVFFVRGRGILTTSPAFSLDPVVFLDKREGFIFWEKIHD